MAVRKIVAPFSEVRKRDGRLVSWNQDRITSAIAKSMDACGEEITSSDARKVSNRVVKTLNKNHVGVKAIHIEDIQDAVEESLIMEDFAKTAKAYILYRYKRAELRESRKVIPSRVRELAAASKKYFRNPLSEFIYYRTYSRWNDEESRRETWVETVDRYVNFMRENIGTALLEKEYDEIRSAILNHEVMPSMRLMWSAGPAAAKSNVAAYNCSFVSPSTIQDFSEIMYLSMCGTGVGFSVESKTAQQLPIIQEQTGEKLPGFVVPDSKEGWADSLAAGMKAWYGGKDIEFDFSHLRPAGARLATMGGRSSGPEPLRALLAATREKLLARQGKRLRNIDVHDIICKIGEIVVAGGVRRSALISLSDLDDEEMRHAKDGQFYLTEPQRSMANNSAVYERRPSTTEFLHEWLSLAKAGTGERGIFNRGGLKTQVPKRRWKVLEPHVATTGTNPCGEITLRSKQFCNLTSVVARVDDNEESLMRKVRIATIMGTYQSTLTNFKYLSPEWKKNCEEERLLGVSLSGQWDSPIARKPEILNKLRVESIKVNKKYAKRMGINPSTSITCVKPEGNSSQLTDASSGMHPRYAKYYIRRVRISATDPLFHMLRDQKFPHHAEVGQAYDSATTYVLEFPVKAPENAVTKNDLSALDQLEHWKDVKENYTEHNPSVTISVGDDEWLKTANWLYENWDILGGLSFLPRSDHAYQLAPYEEITKEQYEEMVANMPQIDFSEIVGYEHEDKTQGAKELACVGGICDIDDAMAIEANEGEGAEVTSEA